MSNFRIKHGDAREILAQIRANSIDAIVCDPPAGISFMGKEWDHDYGHRDEWIKAFAGVFALALKALKPGAHGLVWALPRTSHWTATALEDAGFEIRDVVMHLFGTGFPKSLDVSKAIDAKLGADREVIGEDPDYARRNPNGKYGLSVSGNDNEQIRAATKPITTPGSPEAARFVGWGTALKPAAEHWILIRKPIIGTIAANVLAHGTGGLNIDGCRIATEGGSPAADRRASSRASGNAPMSGKTAEESSEEGRIGRRGSAEVYMAERPSEALGRWPAHLALDEEAAAMLDAQSGVSTSAGGRIGKKAQGPVTNVPAGQFRAGDPGFGDTGGASRFFYVAKASRAEREAGLDDLPVKTAGEATGRVDGTDGLKSPRAGAGRTGGARNHHPTVKSVALMRWLIRLVTPPGGIVLDPFMGSGSTGIAALSEGMQFIGIEREEEYVEIARKRLEHAERS
jgi:site-specific DNA-methyltransferase (adenine-specific)